MVAGALGHQGAAEPHQGMQHFWVSAWAASSEEAKLQELLEGLVVREEIPAARKSRGLGGRRPGWLPCDL